LDKTKLIIKKNPDSRNLGFSVPNFVVTRLGSDPGPMRASPQCSCKDNGAKA